MNQEALSTETAGNLMPTKVEKLRMAFPVRAAAVKGSETYPVNGVILLVSFTWRVFTVSWSDTISPATTALLEITSVVNFREVIVEFDLKF